MRERVSAVDSHSEISGLMATLCPCRYLPGDFGRASFFEVWCVGCAGSDAVGHHLHLIPRSPSRSNRTQEVEEHLKQWQLDHTLGWTATSEVLHLLQKVSVIVRLEVWMENSIMLHLWLVSKSSLNCVAMVSKRIVVHPVAVQMDLASNSTWRSAALNTIRSKFSCASSLCLTFKVGRGTMIMIFIQYGYDLILYQADKKMPLYGSLSRLVTFCWATWTKQCSNFIFLRCAYLLEFCSSHANEGGSIFF